MCRVLIFDLDGTLVDDVEAHVEAWRRAMENLGRKVSDEEIRRYRDNVGKSLRDIMREIYGEIDEEFLGELRKLKNRHFRELIKGARSKIPREVLEELKKRYVLSVFTSTNRETAHTILRALKVNDLFDVVVTAEDVRRGKPHPDGIYRILEETGCEDALFVGDTRYDEGAARAAGVKFIYVEEFLRTWRSLL